MMAQPTEDTIRELLLSPPRAPAVTIYMPTHETHSPPNMYEDEVRFKNLRSRALDIMRADEDIDYKTAQQIDTALLNLEESLAFWESRTQGLVVLADPKSVTTLELPFGCDEYVAVGERFHVSPVIGLLHQLPAYYILLVSVKEPLLLSGDSYTLLPADIPLPASGHSGSETLRESKRLDRLAPKRSDTQPEYFGGAFPVTNDDERLNFFKNLDRAIREGADQKRPLILAGTTQDVAGYRAVASYRTILPGQLPYANTEADLRKLHHDAHTLIEQAVLRKEREAVAERYEQLAAGTGRATAEIAAIEDAADDGRVDTLIMKLTRRTSDNIHSGTADVTKLVFFPDEQMATADYLAVQTWRNRGTVVLMDDTPELPPRNAPLGAIFRY